MMDTHTRYSTLQPPCNTSDLWGTLSQQSSSAFLPSPSSSFTDLREVGVMDNSQCLFASNTLESNPKSFELLPERELTLDNIQRKLSLDFLNSNRRDMQIESEMASRVDCQDRQATAKDTTSSMMSLAKPVLHNMTTARSLSPLPGVHTFCRKKPESLGVARSPLSGEVPSDFGFKSNIPFEGSYQTQIDDHSPDIVYSTNTSTISYPSGNYTSVNSSSAADRQPTYDTTPPMITAAPDSTYQFAENGHEAFALHVYPSSPTSGVDSTTNRLQSRPVITSVQHPHRSKEQVMFKTIDQQISSTNYGRPVEGNTGYYGSTVVPHHSSTPSTYEYCNSNLNIQDSNDYSTAYCNRSMVVNPSSTHSVTFTDINGDDQLQVIKQPALKRPQTTNNRPTNQCHICRKTYGRPSTLKTHVRTHLGDRPYHCQLCGKSFTQPANLTAHIRIHSGEKPFTCMVCARQFSQSSSLKTHMRTHSGERPYMCNICKKSFADSSTLTKHRRTHTGEKPYQCSVCLQHFSQSGNLKRHMKVHLDS